MNQLTIVKIGGNIVENEVKLGQFLKSFAKLEGNKILVHGGGKEATSLAERLGVPSKYVDGRRVTDEEMLKLVVMVYGGLINKRIVALLQKEGCNAIGLTGADGNAIQAVKRKPGKVDYGFVGDVTSDGVNTDLMYTLLQKGFVPVLAPLTHDMAGNMLNTNADTIAQEVARACAKENRVVLVYGFEKSGVLLDVNDEASVIPVLKADEFKRLKEEKLIYDGMIPKLENAFAAVAAGVEKIIIGNAEELEALVNGASGTQIV